jgi:hypothetical protein
MTTRPLATPAFSRFVAAIVAFAVVAFAALGASSPAAATTNVDVTIKVVNSAGTPLTGVTVYAVAIENGAPFGGYDAWVEATPVVGKPGYYVAASLEERAYTLTLEPSGTASTTSFAQLLGGVSDWVHASTFTPGPALTELDVSLAGNAVITGKITSPTGAAIKGATVYAHYYDGSTWSEYSRATTNSSGNYTLTEIDPGSYKLEVVKEGSYPTIYSGSAASFEDATPINVALGTKATANVKFRSGGTITGVVRYQIYEQENAPNYALPGAYPIAYPLIGSPNAFTGFDREASFLGSRSTSTGAWSIKGLPDGYYMVVLQSFYSDVTSGSTPVGSGLSAAPFDYTIAALKVTAGKTTVAPKTVLDDHANAFPIRISAIKPSPSFAAIPGSTVIIERSDIGVYITGVTDASGNFTTGTDTYPRGQYTVTVIGPDDLWEPQTITYSLADSVKAVLLQPMNVITYTSAPSIAETATAVGTEYAVAATPNQSANVTYQWLRDGKAIFGANAASYTSRGVDFGSTLSVRVRASVDFKASAFATVTAATVTEGPQPTPVVDPAISGSSEAIVGNTLHVSPGTWSVTGTRQAFEWFIDGVSTGNTTSSYLIGIDDLDHELTVHVTASKFGHPDSDVFVSAGVTPTTAPAPEPLSSLPITSTTKGLSLGQRKYTISAGKWSASALTYSYSWRLGDVEFASATTFIDLPSYNALPLSVVVTATRDGFETAHVSQVVRKAVPGLINDGAPLVAHESTDPVASSVDSVVVGEELFVSSTGAWSTADPEVSAETFTYQWYRAGSTGSPKAISGATASTYVVKDVDVNYSLSVAVTAHAATYADAQATAFAGKAIASSLLQESPASVVVTGSGAPGAKAIVAVTAWPVSGVKMTYQWFVCLPSVCPEPFGVSGYSKISTAKSSSYVPTSSQQNGKVYVEVTAKRTGYLSVTVLSPAFDIAAKDLIPVESAPAIVAGSDGDAHTGKTVSLRPAKYPLSSISRSYQWQVCASDTDCSDELNWIKATGGGATSTSFKPNSADFGIGETQLRVVERASKSGHIPVFTASEPVEIGLGSFTVSKPKISASGSLYTISAAKSSLGTSASIEWLRGDVVDHVGDTQRSYPWPNGDTSKVTWVRVTYAPQGYAKQDFGLIAQTSTTAITAKPFTIVGDSYGQKLTLSDDKPLNIPSYLKPYVSVTYMWTVDSYYTKPKTTTPYFTPPASAIYKQVRVIVTLTGVTTYPAQSDAYVELQPGNAPTVTKEPVLSHSASLAVGSTVKVSKPTFSPSASAVKYQWQRSADDATWSPITGATSSSYKVVNDDVDSYLRAVVTGTRTGFDDSPAPTASVHIDQLGTIESFSAPTISTETSVGSSVAVGVGEWTSGVTFTYQWYNSGTPIPGATGATYVPVPTLVGNELSVVVTAHKTGYVDLAVGSNMVRVGEGAAPTALVLPAVSGLGTSVSPLTASTGSWTVGGLEYAFQWYSDGSPIAEATTSTFVLDGQARESMSVTITTKRAGFAAGQVTVSLGSDL